MCKGGILFLQLIIHYRINLYNIFDSTDYLELKVPDIAISLSLH